jgi:hypothetical protein
MVKSKSNPIKHEAASKKQRIDPPGHSIVYKIAKFIDIPAQIGVQIIKMLGAWNLEAFKRISIDASTWSETMEIKKVTYADFFGLFVKQGNVVSGVTIALMKGDIIILPTDCRKAAPETQYDIQPITKCTYTKTNPSGETEVHEFDCYIRGTGERELFNGQLCNHTCLKENQNCEYVDMEPVDVSLTEDGTTHSLKLPLVGVRTTKDIKEDSECLVHYGMYMLSDKKQEGFMISCQCKSCAENAESMVYIRS